MSTRRKRNPAESQLPPLLARIIHAAGHAPTDADRAGHDAVLADLGRWALVSVPSRGVLAPADDHVYRTIEVSAVRHLRHGDARRALRRALSSLESLEQRDAIESALNWTQSTSDTAYYYAGLACGITIADLAALR